MARPRVIINDRCLRNPRTGVGHYVAQLIGRVPAMAADIDLLPFYTYYFGRYRAEGNREMTRATLSDLAPPRPGDLQAVCRQTDAMRMAATGGLAVAAAERRSGRPVSLPAGVSKESFSHYRWPDWFRSIAHTVYDAAFEAVGSVKGYHLYHEPNHVAVPWHGPIVTTIHDLSVVRHPEWHPTDRVRWYEREFEPSLARSSHFIAVSEFTRQEMIELLDIPPHKITTIPNGVGALFYPRPPEEVRGWLLQQDLPEQYLLFVGTIEPRKNLTGLISAYTRLPAHLRENYPLVLAGMAGWSRESVFDLLARSGAAEDACVLGYVPDEALAMLYCGARALVWPSFYEGFGLPPLEAMACGTPVVTSTTSSMPEVVGEAGLLVNPYNIGRLSEAIRHILEDDELVRSLSEKGLARSSTFSWSQSIAQHIEIYRRFGRAES